MPEIAVIIAARIESAEQLGWLNEALGSVHQQTFKDVEVVVVDDGSPFAFAGGSDVRFIRSDKSYGPGSARNAGVRATTASWIICLDADDHLKPEALSQLYAKRCVQGIVYGDYEHFGAATGIRRLKGWDISELQRMTGPVGITALFHRNVWNKLEGWDETLEGLEDIEFWIRCTERGICGVNIGEVVLEYRKRTDSRSERLKPIGKALTTEIAQRHANFMRGNIMAPCASCPGGSSPAPVSGEMGTVQLRYIGPAMGSFKMPRTPETGNSYYIDGGKGALINADPRDVEFLLAFRRYGLPEFVVVEKEPPVAAQVRAIMADAAEAAVVTDITELDAVGAIDVIVKTTDILDLNVYRVQEENRAKGKRKSVMAAIEKTIREVTA